MSSKDTRLDTIFQRIIPGVEVQEKIKPPCMTLRIIHGGQFWMGSIIPSSTFLLLSCMDVCFQVYIGLSSHFLICTVSSKNHSPGTVLIEILFVYLTIRSADSPLTFSWDPSLHHNAFGRMTNQYMGVILLILVIYFYRSLRIFSEFYSRSAIDARLHTSNFQNFRPILSLNRRASHLHWNHSPVLCVYNIQ